MTTQRETAYRRLRPDIGIKELQELYTPTPVELDFVRRTAKRPVAQLAVGILLKTCQYLGYLGPVADVPEAIRLHIAQIMSLTAPRTLRALDRYDRSGTKRAHVEAIRSRLKIKPFRPEQDGAWLQATAEQAAEVNHNVPDIVNVLLEELVRHRFEIPGLTRLERTAVVAQARVHNRYLGALASAVTPEAKAEIDELLKRPPGASETGWNTLKREPTSPSNKQIRFIIQHTQRLRKLADRLPKVEIPVPKLRFFRTWARALDASQLSRLKPATRYGLAVIFIHSQQSQALDDASDMFVRMMQRIENRARHKLQEHQLKQSQSSDVLIAQLKSILEAYQIDGSDSEKVNAITDALIADVRKLLADCDAHLAYANKNFLPFLLKPYASHRILLLNCLEIAGLQSSSQDKRTVRLIKALLENRDSRKEEVASDDFGLDFERDLAWLTPLWRRHVVVRSAGRGKPATLNRRFLELAMLFQVRDELRSGDLFVPRSERYDDYREELVDDETLARELDAYGKGTGLSTNPAEFVATLRAQLNEKAAMVDAGFPENAQASIVDGKLVLTRIKGQEQTEAQKKLDALISERTPETSIVDVLIDTCRWTRLQQFFKSVSEGKGRIASLLPRVVTTLFCYGLNLGPVQTARSVKGFSRKQIAWLNLQYVSEETLDRANVAVINAYNRYELPRYWGSGKSVSADGTHWTMYPNTIMAESHVRYGGFGGIGYYHVSDRYIALFSRFTTCGAYEAIHILDGLLENKSDIQPDTVHGDTQAQNLAVFALAYLLGIKLMPRIRGIGKLAFARPDPKVRYPNMDSLFSETIDWKLIETHLADMMRVAVSIKLGRVSSSTVLRRLGNYSRNNKLYRCFRELGKVMRTLFLLDYIHDFDLRREIHAAVNKSEEFNGFLAWVFFGGGGVISENVRHEQRKLMKYSHLVANMVILFNVEQMTGILEQLRSEGIELTPELMAGLAPYRPGGINRLGNYTMDFSRPVQKIDFSRRLLADDETSKPAPAPKPDEPTTDGD